MSNKSYLQFVEESLLKILSELDSKEEPKKELEDEKELERQNALKSNLIKGLYNNIPVQVSIHAASRAKVRRSDMERKDWYYILDKITKKLRGYYHGDYIFYSKKYNQGVVVNWNGGRLMIATVLPQGRKNPVPGTDVVIFEKFEYKLIEID